MAYATSNPPKLVSQGIGGGGKIWVYVSADAAGTVDALDYITDGYALGMRVDDIVFVVDTATPLGTLHRVETASATAFNLALGTTVGSATSGD